MHFDTTVKKNFDSQMSAIHVNYELGDDNEIGQRKQSAVTTVNDILRFITPEEGYIFENYEILSNVSSDLSDPFSDFDGAKFYKDQKSKVRIEYFKVNVK